MEQATMLLFYFFDVVCCLQVMDFGFHSSKFKFNIDWFNALG
jgi:hypothetical protein